MVLITRDIKLKRYFNGKKFILEAASHTKTIIENRQSDLQKHGYNTRIIKNKKHGYLLYST